MHRPPRRSITLYVASALMLILASCGGAPATPAGEMPPESAGGPAVDATTLDTTTDDAAATPAAGAERLAVVATTTLVGDVVHAVGGPTIDLTVLMPPGADPHGFEPTPRDVAAVAEADIVFASGIGFDGFLESLAANAGGEAEIATVSDGVDTMTFEEHQAGHSHDAADAASDHHDGDPDPHVWWDPNNVIVWVDNIEQALAARDPANAATYTANAGAFRDALRTLDVWIQGQIATLPTDRRVLVTDHRVMGYFAHRYELTQVGAIVPAFSTAAEASAGEVAALEDAVRGLAVPAIFVSRSVSPALAERVAQDTGTKLVFIDAESLGEPGGPADSYLNFMRSNVIAIVDALKPGR